MITYNVAYDFVRGEKPLAEQKSISRRIECQSEKETVLTVKHANVGSLPGIDIRNGTQLE
jgi:hypothetical protein